MEQKKERKSKAGYDAAQGGGKRSVMDRRGRMNLSLLCNGKSNRRKAPFLSLCSGWSRRRRSETTRDAANGGGNRSLVLIDGRGGMNDSPLCIHVENKRKEQQKNVFPRCSGGAEEVKEHTKSRRREVHQDDVDGARRGAMNDVHVETRRNPTGSTHMPLMTDTKVSMRFLFSSLVAS